MKKYLALDLGDVWTGIAISDPLGIVARPYKTIATENIVSELHTILHKENIGTIVVGYPKTMKGLESTQTKKVLAEKEKLEKEYVLEFPDLIWILWDERLSSKRANTVTMGQGKKITSKESKLQNHSLAAAFVLDSYLIFRAPTKEETE